MVGSWPSIVSSKIHINGRHVSEPVREEKGKMVATEHVSCCPRVVRWSGQATRGWQVVLQRSQIGAMGALHPSLLWGTLHTRSCC
jgi:hypothetical protein